MWRRDFEESISGRGENMCKDPEMRESKMSSGNKAKTLDGFVDLRAEGMCDPLSG